MGTGEIRALSSRATIITDNRPEIEFHAPISMYDKDTLWDNVRLIRVGQRSPVIRGSGQDSKKTKAEFYYLKTRNSMSMKIDEMSGLERALDLDPSNATYLALEGKRQYMAGLMDSARDVLSHALEVGPENAEANYQMGVLLRMSPGTTQQSTGYFEKAAALEPDNFQYNAATGYHNFQFGRYHEAIKYMRIAEGLPHTIKESMMLSKDMGDVYMALGNLEMAEKSYKKPLLINPYYMDLIRDLAKLYLNTGRKFKACEMLKFAIEVAIEKQSGIIKNLMLQSCN
jgi:tetratricopeptide (TPR) repeat protein